MNLLNITPGKYVIAVSGGVDSVVLLDILSKNTDLELVVAHFDHGIRANSAEDRKFVQQLAKSYNLPFEYMEGSLGSNASEDTARKVRYGFLKEVLKKHKAKAIITAHHQDDVLETIIINIFRGTGRKGLSSLQNNGNILRPLLEIPKNELKGYAQERNLTWQEDFTNTDTKFLRNYIRLQILPKLTQSSRQELLKIYTKMLQINKEIDVQLGSFIQADNSLTRYEFIMLPHNIAKELMTHWLRQNGIRDFESVFINKTVVKVKTLAVGKKISINKDTSIILSDKSILLLKNDRKV